MPDYEDKTSTPVSRVVKRQSFHNYFTIEKDFTASPQQTKDEDNGQTEHDRTNFVELSDDSSNKRCFEISTAETTGKLYDNAKINSNIYDKLSSNKYDHIYLSTKPIVIATISNYDTLEKEQPDCVVENADEINRASTTNV